MSDSRFSLLRTTADSIVRNRRGGNRSFLMLMVIAACLPMSAVRLLAESPVDTYSFKNMQPDVAYIGTDKCVECHGEQHASYLRTTHSRSAELTDAADELVPASHVHPVLGFRYGVEARDGQVIHREVIPDAGGEPLITTEKAIRYTVGSGAHAKSYLFRDGDFLGQSPLTWYAEPNAIRMSPGFEGPFQPSFHRKIESECVFCHVGRVDLQQHNPFKFEIQETAIGCERCHGPGELHAQRYRDGLTPAGADDTIVNPDQLPRELAEAICQQCHLQGVTWVSRTGREMWDYRPGAPITDVRVDYQFADGGGQMRIVGHVEQMHASDCYQQSESLTCTTCHDPHDPVSKETQIAYYRSVCLDCHQDQSCGKSLADRMSLADNSCYECHMPRAATNVTHAAFHQHKIGVHRDPVEPTLPAKAELLPVLGLSSLSDRERTRCLSVAKVLTLRGDPNNPRYNHFGFEATESLIKLKASGPLDPLATTQLALLALAQNQFGISEGLAGEVLATESRPTLARIEATALLAKLAMQRRDFARAAELLEQLTRLRRDAEDHYRLGVCRTQQQEWDAALSAFQRSLDVDPLFRGPRSGMEAVYNATQQPQKADSYAVIQRKIAETMQQRMPPTSAQPQ